MREFESTFIFEGVCITIWNRSITSRDSFGVYNSVVKKSEIRDIIPEGQSLEF
jgi:hypothetical protein